MPRRSARLSKYNSIKSEDAEGNASASIGSASIRRGDKAESHYSGYHTKRQRRASQKGAKQQKNVRTNLLATLPVEILLEIISYLLPSGLLALAKANRALHNHLMSSRVELLWKRARENIGAPVPPQGFSEIKWANLLFGEFECQHCGGGGALQVDFGLCRRLCAKCLQKNLVTELAFTKKFPGYDTKILDMVLYTYSDRRELEYRSYCRLYWIHDIYAMHERLAPFLKDVAMRKSSAKTRLKSFQEERSDAVLKIQNAVASSERWYKVTIADKINKEWQDQRKTQAKSALSLLGFKGMDIDSVLGSTYVNIPGNEASMNWTKARKKFEPLIIANRDRRLLPVRTAALKPTYEAWAKTHKPAKWAYLPQLSTVVRDESVNEAFQGSSKDIEKPKKEEYTCIAAKLPEIAVQWETTMTTRFEHMVAAASDHYPQMGKNQAVFWCSPCREYFVGIEEWVGHPWMCKKCSNFPGRGKRVLHRISTQLTKYLHGLIILLGEDPQTTSPQDLDVLDPRFFCTVCDITPNRSSYTWRQFIAHVGLGSTPNPRHTASLVTNATDLETIRQHEGLKPSKNKWLCALCSKFYMDSRAFSTIKRHLLRSHSIEEPVERQHYIWDYTKSRVADHPQVTIQAQPLITLEGEAQCLHCPAKEVFESVDKIRVHMRAIHEGDVFGREIVLDKDFVMVNP